MIRKSKKKSWVIPVICLAVVFVLALSVVLFVFSSGRVSREVEITEAQQIVDTTFKNLPKPIAQGANKIIENVEIKVNDVKYGTEKDVILNCTYSAIDVKGTIEQSKQQLIDFAYKKYTEGKAAGEMQNATKISLAVSNDINTLIEKAPQVTGEVTLYLYETSEGVFDVYLSDETVDTCTGGIISARKAISDIVTANYKGQVIDITNNNTLRTGIKDCLALVNYDSQKPNTGNFLQKWWNDFKYDFYRNFIEDNHWIYLLQGLGTTLAITGISGVFGMLIGFIVAIIRCTNETAGKFKVIDKICRVYLTIIRGTPVMVQLLIIYFVMLLPLGVPKFLSAILCFGLNSGAYVAEIVRGGIMSIDKGQSEAGRSLGFNFSQTMIHFIIPQAFKAVLPALANEFITLLKESSVAFYIGVADLTQGGLKIRSITYSNFMPLVAVAVIYLVIVLILTRLVGVLERRLRKSEH